MQRRQFIMLGLGAGVSLSLGLTLYPVLHSTETSRNDAATLVLDALLPVLLQGALPASAAEQQLALRRSRDAVLQFLPYLPRSQQQQLQQLFLLLQERLGQLALTGHWLSLNELPISSRLHMLTSWRDSYLATLQQAYFGLRELLFGAYYGQPQHWPALQYQPLEFNPYE
ncbi:MAG: hypothetical protein U5L02_03115 [Rheinheimera sp.]|nr:hypothetical protein [Rheinheimera sp.]